MQISLSNYEFRAYRKKTGNIWLHVTSQLLIKTPVSFSIDTYLRNITGTLALPNSIGFEIDGISVVLESASKHDGTFMIHEIKLTVPTDMRTLTPRLAYLSVLCHFDFHGGKVFCQHKHLVFLRPVLDPLSSRVARLQRVH